MDCYCIVYVSEATVLLGEPELLRLLQQARAEHEQASLTGVLLYSEGQFLQVLEGPTEPVREFFARIAADPRHCKLEVLADGPRPARDFSHWHFSTLLPERYDQLPNYRPLPQLLATTETTHVYSLLHDFLTQRYIPLY